MKIRFQADADLNQIILLATLRREPAIDFQTALTAGLAGLSDKQVLAITARAGRVLVTHDRRSMPRHFAEFIATQTSPGLVIIPQHLPIASVVEDLLLIWSATEAEEWTNRLCFLPLG
jgi:hypothetical protein